MFSKKPAQPRNPAPWSAPRKPAMSGSFSVLGPDTAITGNIAASADLHVDGKVDGDITCTALVQGESSEITGAIQAESARLAGRLKGSITVRELVILKSARIDGDVSYEALTIEQGAQVDGRLAPRGAVRIQDGAKPDTELHLTLASSATPG
jgi:cytoskeletal protein CcmA (bactofilin family)